MQHRNPLRPRARLASSTPRSYSKATPPRRSSSRSKVSPQRLKVSVDTTQALLGNVPIGSTAARHRHQQQRRQPARSSSRRSALRHAADVSDPRRQLQSQDAAAGRLGAPSPSASHRHARREGRLDPVHHQRLADHRPASTASVCRRRIAHRPRHDDGADPTERPPAASPLRPPRTAGAPAGVVSAQLAAADRASARPAGAPAWTPASSRSAPRSSACDLTVVTGHRLPLSPASVRSKRTPTLLGLALSTLRGAQSSRCASLNLAASRCLRGEAICA